ncbi:MAG TPA: 3-dehydroquinate synthase [Alphaproteobacteria bacterium]|nr:3-dehydroquinate synthase [Alphaproteobacteria bacterium]
MSGDGPSPSETVTVALDTRAYDIVVGAGVLDEAGARLKPVTGRRPALVISDKTVAGIYLDRLVGALQASGIPHNCITVPPGEATKSFSAFARLAEGALKLGVERGTVVVALGGGVVGDLAGFLAATLLRGLDFVQIPTTLLAQVDSSVGGKTGINTNAGKNLVGAFHQPRLVLADIGTLQTLNGRELRAGYAETMKYGLIDDPAFYAWCEDNAADLLAGDIAACRHAVVTACRAKARIVAEDERETGARALLNLGHTFGHALEAAAGYSDALLHGEAVAIGIVMAFDLSVALGLCPPEDAGRVRRHLTAHGMPTGLDACAFTGHTPDPARLIDHMAADKKVKDGRIRFVLARGIGKAFVAEDVALGAVRELLDRAAAA